MHILPTYLEQGIAPDVIDDTNPDDVYLGFAKWDLQQSPNLFLIKRITRQTFDGKVITKVRYPFGRYTFNFDWESRFDIIDWRYRDFPADGLALLFSSTDAIEFDISSIDDWNDELLLTGTGFELENVIVAGNLVTLIGNYSPDLINFIFENFVDITSITDKSGVTIQNPTTKIILTFDDIVNVPVADAASVADWNTLFDLPAKGVVFEKVVVKNNTVFLLNSTGLILKDSIFNLNANLLSFIDYSGIISEAEGGCFNYCTNITLIELPKLVTAGAQTFAQLESMTTISLPLLETIGVNGFMGSGGSSFVNINLPSLKSAGNNCFYLNDLILEFNFPLLETIGIVGFASCSSCKTFNLPKLVSVGGGGASGSFQGCTAAETFNLPSLAPYLGPTSGEDYMFFNIIGQNITLTIPAALMTCNAGNPDGDIQYLQANNTVTIITV